MVQIPFDNRNIPHILGVKNIVPSSVPVGATATALPQASNRLWIYIRNEGSNSAVIGSNTVRPVTLPAGSDLMLAAGESVALYASSAAGTTLGILEGTY